MPVIVVGADTAAGGVILEGFQPSEREIRVFVSDEGTAQHLRGVGFKVALGDVSDESHVEAAATRCFSAVLIAEAAADDRERAFADSSQEVMEVWARAVANSRVTRVIWVAAEDPPQTRASEVAKVDPGDTDLAGKVAALDDAQSISTA